MMRVHLVSTFAWNLRKSNLHNAGNDIRNDLTVNGLAHHKTYGFYCSAIEIDEWEAFLSVNLT